MTRPFSFMLLLAGAAWLSGCGSWVGEERAHAMKKEWNSAIGGSWFDEAGERLDLGRPFPTARQKEAEKEKQICLHGNGSNRVTSQDGISDSVEYRRCVLAPYQTDMGARMGNRPDGNGDVVK